MRAARLHDNQTTLRVEEIDDLTTLPGCAIVRVESVFLSPFMSSLIDGSGGFGTPPRPFTPGMDSIGTVESVATDVDSLDVGDPVYCDQYVEDEKDGNYAFAGNFKLSADSGPLLAQWPDGAMATHLQLPVECLTNVSPALRITSSDTLCRLGWFGTAYGAFQKVNLKPGQTIAILGATGLVGSSAVLVALAMGVQKVVAVGRSPEKLQALLELDPRVEIAQEVPHCIDVVLSTMDSDDPIWLQQAAECLNRFGSIVTVASVNPCLSLSDLVTRDLTIRGSLWFERSAPGRLVDMIADGALKVDKIKSQAFSLDNVADALQTAALGSTPFEQVVVNPN